MKRLILCLLLIPTLCFSGQIQQSHKSVITRLTIASASGDTYDTGNIFSETFGTTGADGWDNTPTSEITDGTYDSDPDDQTALDETGFVDDIWDLEVSASSNYFANHDLGSGYSTVYGRFYIYVDSETYANDNQESIVTLTQNGGGQHDGLGDNYLTFEFYQTGDVFYLRVQVDGGSSMTTGTTTFAISLDTPYRIEFYYNAGGASTSTFTWWADDVSTGNPETPTQIGTRATLTLTAVQDFFLGHGWGSPSIQFKRDHIDLDSAGRLVDE